MEDIRVKQIMVPLSEYATVSDKANLVEAIRAMENKNMRFGDGPYRHRAVLVMDSKKRVVGKLGQVDIMRALEPNYDKIGTDVSLSRFGFSAAFMNAIRDQFDLWHRSLLVTAARGKKIVGILRSTDVFNCLCDETRICKA